LILSELFLANLKLVRGDANSALHILAQTEQTARQRNFTKRLPDIAAAQVFTLLRQGDLSAAAEIAQQYDLPMSQARVLLAQGNPSAALTVLASYRQRLQATDWQNAQLRTMILAAIAHHANNDMENARQVLGEALALAEPGGLIRTFVDEGEPMRLLLGRMNAPREGGRMKEYIHRLLAAFGMREDIHPSSLILHPLVEPLSARELQVLQLIAQGLSNREISERLFLALSTVKGHSRIIFDKLQVHNRTQAAARARALGLL
jgi:LuxR family maltose regulon positive regulatory protein